MTTAISASPQRERSIGKVTMVISGGTVVAIIMAAMHGFYLLGQADNRIMALERGREEARIERREIKLDLSAEMSALRVEMREGFKMLFQQQAQAQSHERKSS